MSYQVDFVDVSTVGLESSPVADTLAGLRANEARYFKNKYDHVFTVEPAAEAKDAVDWVHRILEEERGIVIAARPLEATTIEVENTRWTYVFYEDGLSINVLYPLDDPQKRAVGFKLSEGMEVPAELSDVQVRAAEVEAGRDHPRLVLQDQGHVLTGPDASRYRRGRSGASIAPMRPDDPELGPTRITVGCANFEAVPRDKRATLERWTGSSPTRLERAATW